MLEGQQSSKTYQRPAEEHLPNFLEKNNFMGQGDNAKRNISTNSQPKHATSTYKEQRNEFQKARYQRAQESRGSHHPSHYPNTNLTSGSKLNQVYKPRAQRHGPHTSHFNETLMLQHNAMIAQSSMVNKSAAVEKVGPRKPSQITDSLTTQPTANKSMHISNQMDTQPGDGTDMAQNSILEVGEATQSSAANLLGQNNSSQAHSQAIPTH